MKNFLVACVLVAVSLGAQADWSRLPHTADDPTVYVDFDTLKPSGYGTYTLWHLRDFKQAQSIEGRAFRSINAQDEYDCEKRVRREKLYQWHPDAMGKSSVVHVAYLPGVWTAPAEASIDHALMQVVCNRR